MRATFRPSPNGAALGIGFGSAPEIRNGKVPKGSVKLNCFILATRAQTRISESTGRPTSAVRVRSCQPSALSFQGLLTAEGCWPTANTIDQPETIPEKRQFELSRTRPCCYTLWLLWQRTDVGLVLAASAWKIDLAGSSRVTPCFSSGDHPWRRGFHTQ